jgi:hypothetical protein
VITLVPRRRRFLGCSDVTRIFPGNACSSRGGAEHNWGRRHVQCIEHGATISQAGIDLPSMMSDVLACDNTHLG